MHIETGYRSGFCAELIGLQVRYYAKNWGFGQVFERDRLQDSANFLDRFNDKDLILRIEGDNRLLGGLVVDGSDPDLKLNQAHLRWVIIDESLHGQGFGKIMMQMAMDFIKANYQSCYLDTFDGLHAARKLYLSHGFKMVEKTGNNINWNAQISKQYYEWNAK